MHGKDLPAYHPRHERRGLPFKGCLYFGLMLTPDGPRSSSITAASATPKRRWCCRCWKATCCTSCSPAPTARWHSRKSSSPMVLRPVWILLRRLPCGLREGQAHLRPCGRSAARRGGRGGNPPRLHRRRRPWANEGGGVRGVTAPGPRPNNATHAYQKRQENSSLKRYTSTDIRPRPPETAQKEQLSK